MEICNATRELVARRSGECMSAHGRTSQRCCVDLKKRNLRTNRKFIIIKRKVVLISA
jgi:hypothetical protein